MKVFVAANLPDPLMNKIRDAAKGHTIVSHVCRTKEDFAQHLEPDTEVLLARYGLPDPDLAPQLKWVQTCGAGVDHLRGTAFTRTGILFTTASGIHAAGIAELVFAFMLFYQRSLGKMQQYRELRKWPTETEMFGFFERSGLSEQVLGVIGFGAIGREIGRVGAAFGMRVLGVRRNPQQTPRLRHLENQSYEAEVYGMDSLTDVASKSDFLVIALPLTGETQRCINSTVLDAMKPTAILINVARGKVVDEQALIDCLRNGRIRAAALDVYEQEPLAKDHPFYLMDNVFLSPHVAGAIQGYDEKVVDVFVANLGRYLSGQSLLNQVNWALEY